MLALFDAQGKILGLIHETVAPPEGCTACALPPDVDEAHLEDLALVDGRAVVDKAAALLRVKTSAVQRVKAQAAQRIEALAWRVERAQERDALGVAGETVQQVQAEREAIRRASGRVEAAIMDAADAEAAEALAEQPLEVTPQDAPQVLRMTPLAFFSRFTPQEQATILEAARSNGALQSVITGLQLSAGVNLDDARIHAGVQLLEGAGLIGAGRAAQILAGGAQE